MASIRLNKQAYSRLAVLERSLYEMARTKVERTIDPKLWAAMASLCSRNYKNDLGEFAKPIGTTKDVLLARYVAGLIILKQPCPSSPADIDNIKALKQYGHKLVDELNVSIDEIQNLYNQNCGNLPKANRASNNVSSAPEMFTNDAEDGIVSDIPIEQERVNHHSENIHDNLGTIGKKSIRDIWDNILDRTQKTLEAEKKLRQQKKQQISHKPIDVSKIDKLKVRRADGTIDEIYPARIARYANYFIGQLSGKPETKVLKKYFPKNIIWTFEVPTAATDGIRVFFNPAFADRLFSLDSVLINNRMTNNPNDDPEEMLGTMFQYVLIHEIYHQIYRHMHRIRMKPETASALSNKAIMDLANIACDVEINRDIEFQLPQFQGCTELLGGMFDKRFTHETWELIFDAYNTGEANPPQVQNGLKGKNPSQPNQQQNPGNNSQNQSDDNGNDLDDDNDMNNGNNSGNNSDASDDSDYNDDDKNAGGNNNQPSLNNKSKSYLKGFRDALEKINSGEIDIDNWSGYMTVSNSFNSMIAYGAKRTLGKKNMQTTPVESESEEFNQQDYDKGFRDAIKLLKEAIKNKKKQAQNSGNSNLPNLPNMGDDNDSDTGGQSENSDEDIQDDTSGNGTGSLDDIDDDADDVDKTISGDGMEAETYDGDFGSDDMISKEDAQRIAENAGQPYDADDMAEDPEQKARNFVKNNREQLSKIGGNGAGGAGKGKSLGDVLDHIDTLFQSTVNWRNQLQSFLNGLAKTGRDYEFQRRRIGTDNPVLRPSRYIKYNEITFDEKTAVAQVFYLIDNSGSMYCQSVNGKDTVFMQIFSDILSMQKRAKIQKSALTYFSYGEIDKEKIRMWDHKTTESRIKQLIGRNRDDSGGTDIVGSIEQIYNLGKPYYSKNDPKTLMIVMTDGEDDLRIIKDLPSAIKQNIIFMILNSANRYLQQAQNMLVEAGIRKSRILLVDTHDIGK